jgi:hypothetical protein
MMIVGYHKKYSLRLWHGDGDPGELEVVGLLHSCLTPSKSLQVLLQNFIPAAVFQCTSNAEHISDTRETTSSSSPFRESQFQPRQVRTSSPASCLTLHLFAAAQPPEVGRQANKIYTVRLSLHGSGSRVLHVYCSGHVGVTVFGTGAECF